MSENIIASYRLSEVYVKYKIKQFRKIRSYKAESHDFSMFGSKWYLMIYPEHVQYKTSYVGLFLGIRNISDPDQTVNFKLGIKKSDDSDLISKEGKHKFTKKNHLRGWYEFIKRSTLLKSEDIVAPDGSLTVFCTIYSNDYIEVEFESTKSGGAENLSKNLKDLYVSGKFSDVTIVVKEKEFTAHRNVLAARSKVFESMFMLDMMEKVTGKVEIKDCDPVSFDKFLLFLYSGKLGDVSWNHAINIYIIGEKYDVPSLKIKCVKCLINTLSVDSICDVISLATVHGEDELMTVAKKFFTNNAKAILSNAKWKNFIVEHPLLGNELFLSYVKNNEK